MKLKIIPLYSILLQAVLLTQTQANPLDVYAGTIEQRAVDCKAVTGVLAVVRALGAPATSFCSSYLGVPTAATKLTTTTPTR
jgi:hypothetical protein